MKRSLLILLAISAWVPSVHIAHVDSLKGLWTSFAYSSHLPCGWWQHSLS